MKMKVEFQARLQDDSEFRRQLLACTHEADRLNWIKSQGYDISAEELQAALQQAEAGDSQPLTCQELDAVSGGGPYAALMDFHECPMNCPDEPPTPHVGGPPSGPLPILVNSSILGPLEEE